MVTLVHRLMIQLEDEIVQGGLERHSGDGHILNLNYQYVDT
jgi:hypothetical protein